MGNFVKEFKEFAVKGNAIDMAVGVIIGGAFGNIVNSIVNDIIMPPIGWLIGGVNFSDLKVELPRVVHEGIELAPATLPNPREFSSKEPSSYMYKRQAFILRQMKYVKWTE